MAPPPSVTKRAKAAVTRAARSLETIDALVEAA
jgi:hypothetical protein